jgi:acetyl-CoA acetyltransferase
MSRDPARTPVLVEGLRTPFGRYGGALKDVRPDDMAAHVISALVERTGIDPSTIDDVILGAAIRPTLRLSSPACRSRWPARP